MAIQLWSGRWKGGLPAGDTHHRSREVISSSGAIMRGKFPSRKNGRVVHHEGMLELDAIYLFEASPHIALYGEQPERVFYPDGARLRRYTPDFVLTLVDGTQAWVEVKPSRYLLDAEISHKLDCIAIQMQRNGMAFCILTESTLRHDPRQTIVRTIWQRAPRIPPTTSRAEAALKRCAARLPLPLKEALPVFAAEGVDVYSLLLLGYLRCSLDVQLTPQTVITESREADDGWFWLSQKHGF